MMTPFLPLLLLKTAVNGKCQNGVSEVALKPEDGPEKTKQFVVAFKERYGKFPDTWAAQGYDATMLLAAAIEKAGSSNPKLISQSLRSMEWLGVTGLHKFDKNGDGRNFWCVLP